MASLSGSVTTTNPDFNIDTTDGQGNAITTTDWVHWTNTGGTSQRKSGGGSLISNYTAFNGLENQFTGYARTISWTNGTPTASGSDQTGIYLAATGAGSGFTFTFPADSLVLRTAYVFIGGFQSTLNLRPISRIPPRRIIRITGGAIREPIMCAITNSRINRPRIPKPSPLRIHWPVGPGMSISLGP